MKKLDILKTLFSLEAFDDIKGRMDKDTDN